jgi:transmembrane sensor
METDKPEMDDLFMKKLNGTLSASDKVYLEERLHLNTDSQREFQDHEKMWTSSATLETVQGRSRDQRWDSLQEKIQQEQSHALKRRVWLRYAASIGVIVALASAYFFLKPAASVEIQTRYGQTKRVILPDESTVVLNAGSSLLYDPSTWEDERAIRLEGEAYFEVKKSVVTFSVTSGDSRVEVLGTAFNVKSRHETTAVACLTGKVKFGNSKDNNQSVVLTKGTAALLRNNMISEVYPIGSEDAIQWVTGDLSFNNTPLKEVFAELERHFNKKIIVKKDLGNLTFTGKFKEPELNNVIKTICLSAGLAYSISVDTITIK